MSSRTADNYRARLDALRAELEPDKAAEQAAESALADASARARLAETSTGAVLAAREGVSRARERRQATEGAIALLDQRLAALEAQEPRLEEIHAQAATVAQRQRDTLSRL